MCSDIPKVLLNVLDTHVCVLISYGFTSCFRHTCLCSDILKVLLHVGKRVCVLMFLNLYLSVVAGSIPVGVLINIPGWTHVVLVLSFHL